MFDCAMTAFPGRVRLSGRDLVFVLEPAEDLLSEIRELGYSGSMNRLYRYITQGRVEAGPRGRVCGLASKVARVCSMWWRIQVRSVGSLRIRCR